MHAGRWAELKEAFWALADAPPDEQARLLAALESSDPTLHRQLRALLAADARGDGLEQIFPSAHSLPVERPTRIGPYEVVGVLGAGGMGEVYRARDARLRREVAIKILPAAFTIDRERLARFAREAQALASLNHPHIAQVYGLEESEGVPSLVMELVEGPTLAALIASHSDKPVALRQVLRIARQIADGLDAAHEKGIIHRDLKPSNIALTEAGDVKILDFGVAKTTRDEPRGSIEGATDAGRVLGTPAYMSPEQARGLAIDKRTDIWAFGCVLYELLTGQQPFAGTTASDSIAAILEHEPDMTVLPTDLPRSVRALLRHCLEKDPRRRLRDIADARFAIDDVLNQSVDDRLDQPASAGAATGAPRSVRAGMLWLVASLAIIAVVAAIMVGQPFRGAPPPRVHPVLASVVLPPGMSLGGHDPEARSAESSFAVSPNGRRLAVVAADGSGPARLWLRDLDSGAFQPLPDTERASYPFWSPDSEYVAFIAGDKLKKIRASGGTPSTVCDGGFRTGAWSRSDVILFAPAASSPLHRVPASGGDPIPVTRLDQSIGEVQHSYPAFLPDGRHFLYFSVGSKAGGAIDPRGVYVGSLDGTEPPRLLLPGATHVRYANGRVLFLRNGSLMAQALDLGRLELRGAPAPLVEGVKVPTAGTTGITGAFSVSDDGVLVYQTGWITQSQPVWFDRAGRKIGAVSPQGDYADVALSPDGTSLALSVADQATGTRDLWLYDAASDRRQRFTFDPGDDFAPVWSPDGRRLLFSSFRTNAVNLYLKDVNGLGGEQPLTADMLGLGKFAADWSGEGFIMYMGGGRIINRSDLWILPIARPHDARGLLESPFIETHGRLSPDGRWFVYTSDETGRFEVYIDRFPGRGAKRLVSTGGGGWARWSKNGREIFYLSPDNQLMVVAQRVSKDGFGVAAPRTLFTVRPRPPTRLDAYPYDVSPDGQRFVVNTLIEETTPRAITLLLNWTEALK